MRETWVQSLGWEDPLEKGNTTHSSILAWRIPWTVQPMVLQSQTERLSVNQRSNTRPQLNRSQELDFGTSLPGGPGVKNSPSNAVDKGFIPGWGTKIPHASGQLSLSTAVREAHVPQLPSPHCPTTATTEPVCSRAHESESHTIVSDPLQPHGL